MHIAVQAADLDAERIDGTRVYIRQLLNRFGEISSEDEFFLYHKTAFNEQLAPKLFPNYHTRSLPQKYFWTQTKFARSLFRDTPDALWMPVQSIPLARPRKMQTTVTIHDLAFHFFPQHFPFRDRVKLFSLASMAIRFADHIIAVSNNTKKDILRLYPETNPEKITVVYHGYDAEMFQQSTEETEQETLIEYGLFGRRYILYLGAIQPRKNLVTLVRAFEMLKKKDGYEDVLLVIAGERAWLWNETIAVCKKSAYSKDIILPGKVPFVKAGALLCRSAVFAYPSLYEGFGLPVLEGFAAGVPVVCASGSSLDEVAGDSALMFDPFSVSDMATAIERALSDEGLREFCIRKGKERLREFSWDRCAHETLAVIRGEKKGI